MRRICIIFAVFFVSSCVTSYKDLTVSEAHNLTSWNNSAVVTTRYGTVKGRQKKDYFLWTSIPYAQPPTGKLRWKAPRSPEPWDGTLYTIRKPPDAVQYGLFPKKAVTGQEDCLYLNIWRPASEDRDLPVYVWIHGGGNSSGSSMHYSDYYGESFVRKVNAVFVSLNYRLGPFGWFTHPALRDTSVDADNGTLDASGNYGLLDIQAALQWVRDNITAFGGDTDNITVAGESAGAINILALLQSPLSKDLFHKAIIRSGGIMQSTLAEGDSESARVLRELLQKDRYDEDEIDALLGSWSQQEIADYLRAAKPKDIIRCFAPRSFGMISLPVLFTDGKVLPKKGDAVFREGTYPVKVPFIIGSNRDEVKLFFSGRKELRKNEELYQAACRLGSDTWRVNGVDSVVRRSVQHADQPPIFSYYFTWGTLREDGKSVLPCNRGETFGSCHGIEVPFFHGTTDTTVFGIIFFSGKNRKGVELLDDAIIGYTKDFLWTKTDSLNSLRSMPSDTDNQGVPPWTPWQQGDGTPKTLVLDAGYKELRIKMSDMEFTFESIDESLRKTYPEEVYNKTVEFLEENQMNLESLEKR